MAAIADCPAGAEQELPWLTGHLIGWPVYGSSRLRELEAIKGEGRLSYLGSSQIPSSPPPYRHDAHTNEKLLIMTLKRLACHEVRINLANCGMH